MDKRIIASKIAKDYEKQLNETGLFVCEHCSGTGINPEYQEHNEIVRALDGHDAFLCLSCYGIKQVDWVEHIIGSFLQDLKYRKRELKDEFFDSLESYIYFNIFGRVLVDDYGKCWRYDTQKKLWIETTQALGSVKGQKDFADLILKAIHSGYTDADRYGDYLWPTGDIFAVYHIELIRDIKAELIDSREMIVDRLMRLKEELDIMGIAIEDLIRFPTKNNSEKNLPSEFKFNWEGILKRFNLSKAYLPALKQKPYRNCKLKPFLSDDYKFTRDDDFSVMSLLPRLDDTDRINYVE